ncbi:GDP-mannose 4,6-dehydratase [Alterisphingorhabdus coralli]|uniref:GDP-mannose 4,6-dehydratase n=1 Tax=Alterisphingorhabdus coralli TaxID=3071408 RepID=A0AA97F5X1_9SPHN|nr:NAD-dependent epimerase/dehydratase family protein [Parasphingorhabdus sp. SCSIO 66989]WOE74816.1 GDP-mannose 4,6-dehydratase [Parasphingorhabdus sp. SCSIO 66989]
MAILVTGIAGFIGHALAKALLLRGEQIIGIDNLNTYYDPALKQARLVDIAITNRDFVFHKVNFADAEALDAALAVSRFDRIVHLGAQAGVRYSIENPSAYVQSNLVGHANILELARKREVVHLIYASSSSVYGMAKKMPLSVDDRVDHPVSLYAATKKADELMSETYAHLYRLPMTGLRFFTVYGPWGRPDMAPWKFTKAILNGEPITVYNKGNMKRDFTYIDDIVTGIIATLDAPPTDDRTAKAGGSISPHAIYNIGNNQPVALMDFIQTIEQACDRKAEMVMKPMQPGDVYETYADIDAIANAVGYQPTTSLKDGIPSFVEWYKDYHKIAM